MKKGLSIILITLMFGGMSYAQRWKLKRFEAIAGVGVTNVFGDIGGAGERETAMGLKDYKIKDSRPSFYLGFRYRLTEAQAIKLNIINGFGAANDEGSVNEYRNYSYTTFLFEPSLQYEYYFLPEDRNTKTSAMFSRRGMVNTFSMISFYGFAGIGGVVYVPNFEGELVTTPEKEKVDNSTGFSPVIPLGLGLKYVVNSEISLNLEVGRRFTFTDYIDGLSPVAFSKANDVYYFGTLSVVYKLTTTRRGIPILFEGSRSSGRSKARPSRGRRPVGM